MNKLYNEEIKERFLKTYDNEDTQHVIRYIFYKSEATESMLDKDLMDFDLEELSKTIKEHSPTTLIRARGIGTFISQYISWAIEENLRRSNINLMKSVSNEFYKPLLDKNSKIHHSYDEFIELLESLDNAQDQSMLALWFEGVSGKQFSELMELSYYDVNWHTNELTLKDKDGSKRKLIISDRCMRYLERAKDQQVYSLYKEDKVVELPLCQSNFIFRNTKSRVTKEKEISINTIYNRLHAIQKKFNLENLTQKAISQSGQIYMAYKIFLRDGYFDAIGGSQWKEIGERYNVSRLKSEYGSYVNISLMKSYITERNLKELYNVDIPIEIRKKNKKS